MLQLADCGLKDLNALIWYGPSPVSLICSLLLKDLSSIFILNALQACNRLGEGIPLYYCEGEEGVFVIICRSRDLPEGHGVTVSRYSITVLYVVRER